MTSTESIQTFRKNIIEARLKWEQIQRRISEELLAKNGNTAEGKARCAKKILMLVCETACEFKLSHGWEDGGNAEHYADESLSADTVRAVVLAGVFQRYLTSQLWRSAAAVDTTAVRQSQRIHESVSQTAERLNLALDGQAA
jgi:Cdc6-like AAA superfamily ATPase